MSHQLVWLRTDLRISDQPALTAALAQGPTLCLYCVTPEQWALHADAPSKLEFWRRHLLVLSQRLAALGIPLLVRQVGLWKDLPSVIGQLCQQHAISAVHTNEEYGLNESRRDEAVRQHLTHNGIAFHSYLDQVFFAPGTLTTRSGGYIQVYSPFRKQCLARLLQHLPETLPTPSPQAALGIPSDPIPASFSSDAAATPESLFQDWPIGEAAAQQRLRDFAHEQLSAYHTDRDYPDREGTSRLSPYLTAGVLSPRQCLQAALSLTGGGLDLDGNTGFSTWIDELLWREFYRHILQGHPRLSMGYAFKSATEALPWRNAPQDLLAWQNGQTGLPIIDAAMRCLKATGWMHNRLRMIVAMFLSKNLLIDWREGERWFIQHLLDGDLAQNNGGWQWCASTGTDAVPYFRLFNPVTQSEKFDPQGHFIRRWVPELAHVSARDIHNPAALRGLFSVASQYPPLIVDLAKSRTRALDAFKQLAQPHEQNPD